MVELLRGVVSPVSACVSTRELLSCAEVSVTSCTESERLMSRFGGRFKVVCVQASSSVRFSVEVESVKSVLMPLSASKYETIKKYFKEIPRVLFEKV